MDKDVANLPSTSYASVRWLASVVASSSVVGCGVFLTDALDRYPSEWKLVVFFCASAALSVLLAAYWTSWSRRSK